MFKVNEARASEQSLIAFDMLAAISLLTAPILFEAVESAPAVANPRALIGLVVVVLLFAGVMIYARLSRCEEMDEFVRRTWERACGVAFGVTLATHIVWSTAAQGLLIRPMSAQDVAAVLIISAGLAWAWARVRGARA